MSITHRIGHVLRETDKAYHVRCTSAGRATTDVWVPKSICDTTREGFPPQTIVWAPHWFVRKEGLPEHG